MFRKAIRLLGLLFYEERVLRSWYRINEQLLSPNFVSLTPLLSDIEDHIGGDIPTSMLLLGDMKGAGGVGSSRSKQKPRRHQGLLLLCFRQ